MRALYLLAALPALASAWSEHGLLGRAAGNATSCEAGDKVCGEFCIPGAYTCCPDLEGGCDAKSVCQEGDNGVYGCCPKGDTCSGDGGSEYILGGSATATTANGGGGGSSTTTPSSSTNVAAPGGLGHGISFAVAAAGLAALL